MLAVVTEDGRTRVAVAPVTHTKPDADRLAVAIPPLTAQRLGLDEAPQWIITDDLNLFTWPGFDLRPVPAPGRLTVAYGHLPYDLTIKIKQAVSSHMQARTSAVTKRDNED